MRSSYRGLPEALAGHHAPRAGTRPGLSATAMLPGWQYRSHSPTVATVDLPRCRLLAPTHPLGRVMHPCSLVTVASHVLPECHDGNHGRHHPPRWTTLPLPFERLGFRVYVASMQRWLLFLCNLHAAFSAALQYRKCSFFLGLGLQQWWSGGIAGRV